MTINIHPRSPPRSPAFSSPLLFMKIVLVCSEIAPDISSSKGRVSARQNQVKPECTFSSPFIGLLLVLLRSVLYYI